MCISIPRTISNGSSFIHLNNAHRRITLQAGLFYHCA